MKIRFFVNLLVLSVNKFNIVFKKYIINMFLNEETFQRRYSQKKQSKLSQLKNNKILFQKISRKHFYLLFEF